MLRVGVGKQAGEEIDSMMLMWKVKIETSGLMGNICLV